MEGTYLGDGVYASHDGYQIWLETTRDDGQLHRIAIEPAVLDKLNAYAARLRSTSEAER